MFPARPSSTPILIPQPGPTRHLHGLKRIAPTNSATPNSKPKSAASGPTPTFISSSSRPTKFSISGCPPDNSKDRLKLWDKDVVEFFLGDDWQNIRHYREFEIAPTGDWVDLAIDLDHDTYGADWNSGFEHQGRIDEARSHLVRRRGSR